MNSITRGELQRLAQDLLRAHNYELSDDPRTEIQVARDLGILTLAAGLAELIEEQNDGTS